MTEISTEIRLFVDDQS